MALTSIDKTDRANADASLTCVVVYDVAGRIVEVSRSCAKMFDGQPGDDLLDSEVLQWIVPEHHARFLSFLAAACAGEQATVQVQMVGPAGEFRWVEHRAVELRQVPGRPDPACVLTIAYDITERKQTQETMRLKGKVIEAFVGAIAVVDLTGKVIYANQAFGALWRLDSPRLAFGVPIDAFWGTRGQNAQAMEQTLGAGKWQGEFVVSRADRSTFEAEVVANLVRESDGRPTHIALSFTDVTAARHYQRELERREVQYRALFEASTDGIYIIDALGQIRSANNAAAKMHECGVGELIDKNIADLDDSDSAAHVQERLAECLAGQTLRFEVRHVKPDGTKIPLEVIATAFEYGGEKLILAIDRDISGRLAAEQNLRENEERLRLALASANQGLYDLNLRTGIARVSEEYARMLGFAPGDFHETNAAWLKRLHPEDRVPVESIFRDYIDGRIKTYRGEFRQQLPDGTWKWILSLGKIIAWDEQGNPARMIGTHTDISDLKEAQAELARGQLQLAQIGRVSLANGLAAAVAHELNQPLCATANYMSAIMHTLDAGNADTNLIRESAQFASDAVLRAGKIIHGFKDLFSKRQFTPEPCCWGQLIDSSLLLIGSELRDHQVAVVKDYEADLPMIAADPTLLQQVILNLITNACEAMDGVPMDRRKLLISLRKVAGASQVMMQVTDHGPGIPRAIATNLFASYGSSKPQGLGMGLTICQMIAKAHGGEIGLVSTGPEGSVFALSLPICQNESEAVDEQLDIRFNREIDPGNNH